MSWTDRSQWKSCVMGVVVGAAMLYVKLLEEYSIRSRVTIYVRNCFDSVPCVYMCWECSCMCVFVCVIKCVL